MGMIDPRSLESRIPGLSGLVPLEQGGQKIVFRGSHSTYGNVVLKLLHSSQPNERVRREIDIAISCQIPNTACIYQWGTLNFSGSNHHYILEEFIEGETLRRRLTRAKTLPLDMVLRLVAALLESAVAMEIAGIVHRDIKPENIMCCQNGSFKLLDFGIARHLAKSSITPTIQPFGPHTAGYAAPEQFRNLKKQIDIRADLFSIGVVAYECLVGAHPFVAGARDQLDILRRTETLAPPALTILGDRNGDLSRFISVLMSKYSSRRPASAALAKEWFGSIQHGLKS